MKTKLLLFLLAIFTIVSCHKDDDEPYVIPADKRYLSYVTDKDGKTVLNIEYDENKSFKKFSINGGLPIRYLYDDSGRVKTVFTSGVESNYTYDANGRIVSFTYGGNNYPVTYNAAENSYAYSHVDGNIKIFFDAAGNLNKYKTENIGDIVFFYQNNKNGPLKNGGNMSLTNYIGAFPMVATLQINTNLFSVPLEDMNSATFSISCQNEYDSESFLIKSKITSSETNEYNYHYVEL